MRTLVYTAFPDPHADAHVLKECFVRSAIRLADRLILDDDTDRLEALFAVFVEVDNQLRRLDDQKGVR